MALNTGRGEKRPPELLTQRLINLLRLLDREARETLSREGDLRILDWRILASVAQNSPITVRLLAEKLFISRSEASRSAAVLFKRGLLQRLDDPEDGRSCLFRITPRGRSVYARIMPLRQQFLERLSGQVTPDERETFNRVLHKLIQYLDE